MQVTKWWIERKHENWEVQPNRGLAGRGCGALAFNELRPPKIEYTTPGAPYPTAAKRPAAAPFGRLEIMPIASDRPVPSEPLPDLRDSQYKIQ